MTLAAGDGFTLRHRHEIAEILGKRVSMMPMPGRSRVTWAAGPLAGFLPDLKEPLSSYVPTGGGVANGALLVSTMQDRPSLDAAERQRASRLVRRLVETGLSRWNGGESKDPEALGLPDRFLLLVTDEDDTFSTREEMTALLQRARSEADAPLVLWCPAHATGGARFLARLCTHAPDVAVAEPTCRLAPLLAHAVAVHTVRAHAGADAIVHGRPLTCAADAFYHGFDDAHDLVGRLYLRCARFLDLHDRSPIAPEGALEQVLTVRETRMAMRCHVHTVALSPWKRRAVEPFLVGPGGRPLHHARMVESSTARDVVVWGADRTIEDSDRVRSVRLEDGFIRSSGLGAAFTYPFSLVRAFETRLPFDARGPSVIDDSLTARAPTSGERERAKALTRRLVAMRASKYMLSPAGSAPALPDDASGPRLLVVGQVSDDASLRFGARDVRSNDELLDAVRRAHPEATIAYRDHPDVRSGLRPGRASRRHVDLDVTDHDLIDLFVWADGLHTITSLAGFEALLHGVPVVTWGRPFYAGWGVTEDRIAAPSRGAADVTDLVVAAYLRAASYIHPQSRLPCTPERLLDWFDALPRDARSSVGTWPGRVLGRAKHLLKRIG